MTAGWHDVAGLFQRYLAAGGWLMLPLLLTAFLIWHQYLALLLRLKQGLATPTDCEATLERRLLADPDGATLKAWLAALPGAVPRLVRHVLARLTAGLTFREAFSQCRQAELGAYTYSFYTLGVLVVAAPLLGLLGTVLGMIATFDAVAQRTGVAAEMVAGGISQALITTQVGLVAALPGTFGLAHLYRLYVRLCNRIDRCESHLALVYEHAPARRSAESTTT